MLKRLISLVCFSLLLVACSTASLHMPTLGMPAATVDKSQYANKPLHLEKSMYLIEVKPLNPLSYSGYWLFNFPISTYYNNYIHATVPTLEEYQTKPEAWQVWQGSAFADRARIAGIVDAGTTFHIVDIAPNGYAKGYWVTVQIDEGSHKGLTVMYGNPKSLFPEANR